MNDQECGTTKICKGCDEEKDTTAFTTYFDKRKGKSYTKHKCKECVNKRERVTAASPKRVKVKKATEKARRETPEYKQHMKEYAAQYNDLHSEAIAARQATYRLRPEVLAHEKIRAAAYYDARKVEIQEKRAKFYEDNPDRKEARNLRTRNNYQDNPEYATEKSSRRRRNIKRATPEWYNEQKVIELRKEIKRLNQETDETYNLDHIVPINGKLVSGLHWHGNMQIITEKENKLKAAKHIG